MPSATKIGATVAPSSSVDTDMLLLAVEPGLRVQARHQFFNWTQGALQALLPHDLLVCGVAEGPTNGYRVDSFSSSPPSERMAEALRKSDGGVAVRLVHAWERNGGYPLLLEQPAAGEAGVGMPGMIAEYKLGSVIAHGTCAPSGRTASFFCFCALRGAVTPRHAYAAELLVPYLHAAWVRILHREKLVPVEQGAAAPPDAPDAGVLTTRELEILRWVYEGKSNLEIGMILGISGLTVKNHVQNILRKLNVRNRTQAVAKGLALNLLQRGVHG